ncbi:MAG: hypothetical protein AABW48_03260 [Nanoarchaeota archaeon]
MAHLNIGTIVTAHGWMHENYDKSGGLEKTFFVNRLSRQFGDLSRDQIYDWLRLAEACKAIYEKDSKIYINLPYNKVKKRYYGSPKH